jgi:hypothetical protein
MEHTIVSGPGNEHTLIARKKIASDEFSSPSFPILNRQGDCPVFRESARLLHSDSNLLSQTDNVFARSNSLLAYRTG